jgi:hypothetical protein
MESVGVSVTNGLRVTKRKAGEVFAIAAELRRIVRIESIVK